MIEDFIQKFSVQKSQMFSDSLGGKFIKWNTIQGNVEGYLDMISGSDLNQNENAFTERSTHVLIIPDVSIEIDDEMRIVDSKNRAYLVNYVDDPVGVRHHLEVYLAFDKEA